MDSKIACQKDTNTQRIEKQLCVPSCRCAFATKYLLQTASVLYAVAYTRLYVGAKQVRHCDQ